MATTTEPCRACGARHRAGTLCAQLVNLEAREAHAERVRDVLGKLPLGTLVVFDTRSDRARTRRLHDDALHKALWRLVSGEAESWPTRGPSAMRVVTMCAGAVPNAYGFAAEADWLDGVLVDERAVLWIRRGNAPARAFAAYNGPRQRLMHELDVERALQSPFLSQRYNLALVAAAVGWQHVDAALRTVDAARVAGSEAHGANNLAAAAHALQARGLIDPAAATCDSADSVARALAIACLPDGGAVGIDLLVEAGMLE